ncbi:hypothetical protein RND71_004672 [Anisodus tanguticus]|uniref:Uncharacterized protein n=1 Tax=Anisodus tanguticus TaxID=243964 RepID=A0AAE1SPZ6_9SOLA|nr:hypothetical protein RND71_004672 [Anisodus tanguticus]
MGIMNSYMNDIFEKLAQESSRLARRKPTKSSVRLVIVCWTGLVNPYAAYGLFDTETCSFME